MGWLEFVRRSPLCPQFSGQYRLSRPRVCFCRQWLWKILHFQQIKSPLRPTPCTCDTFGEQLKVSRVVQTPFRAVYRAKVKGDWIMAYSSDWRRGGRGGETNERGPGIANVCRYRRDTTVDDYISCDLRWVDRKLMCYQSIRDKNLVLHTFWGYIHTYVYLF